MSLQEKIKSLNDEREKLLKEAKSIVDANPEGMSAEDLVKVKEKTAKGKELQAQIVQLQDQDALSQQIAADLQWGDQTASRITAPANPNAGTTADDPPPQVRMIADHDGRKKHEFTGGFSEYLRAVRIAGSPGGTVDNRLTVAAAPGMQTAVGSDGGFLVPQQDAAFLIKRAYETGEILRRCRKIPLTGNSIKIPTVLETSRAKGSRWGGVQAYWVDEAGAITDSKPKFGKLELKLKKCACVGYVTEEMLEDYTASAAILQEAFAEELAYEVENSIINGTGSGSPLGILNAGCLVSVAKESSQTLKTIYGDNVINMVSRMWARSRRNGVWLINQDCEPQILKLAAKSEYAATTYTALPLYLPAGMGWNNTEYGILAGKAVIPVEYCATLGTVGDIIFADFSQYLIADKGGPRADVSMHVRFLYDEQTFRLVYRVDGQPAWTAALTPATSSANTLSPFVALATRE
jgi:HK97 family phage major capsid protein